MEDQVFPGNGLLEDFSNEDGKKRQRRSTSKSGATNKKQVVSDEVEDDEDYGDDDSDDDPSWASDAKKQENEEEDDDDEEEEDEYEGLNKRKRGAKGFVNRKPNFTTPIMQRPNTTSYQSATPLSSSFFADQSRYGSPMNQRPNPYGATSSPFSTQGNQQGRPQLSPVQIQQLLEQNPMLKQALVQKLMAAQQSGTPVNPAVLAVLNSSAPSSSVLSSNPSLLSQSSSMNSSLLSSAPPAQSTTITPPPPSLTVPALSSLRANAPSSSPSTQSSSTGGSTISGLSTSGLSAASIFNTSSTNSSMGTGNSSNSLGSLGMGSPLTQQSSAPKPSSSPSLLGPSMGMSSLSSLGSSPSNLGMNVGNSTGSSGTPSTFAPYKFPTMSQPSSQSSLPSMPSPSTSQSSYPGLLGPQQSKPQQLPTQLQLTPQQVQQIQLVKALNPNVNINEYVRMMYTNSQQVPAMTSSYQMPTMTSSYPSNQMRMASTGSPQIDLATQLNQMQRTQESPKTVKPTEIFGGSAPMTIGSPMSQYNSMNMSPMGTMNSQQYKASPMRYPPIASAPNYTNLNAFAQNLKAPTPSMWPGNIMRVPPPGAQLPKPSSDPKLEMEAETDPRRRILLTLVKQCEAYSNQIKEILRQWHEKSLKNKAENESNPFRLPVEGETPSTGEDKESELELIRQPENLKYELRPYQLVGLNWLYLLFSQKINGILADEMGLGKTIQTIGLFSLLKQRAEVKKPHLIIVPATALENWVREFTQCSPSVIVHMYHGSTKEREALRKQLVPKEDGQCNFDVIITTYNLSINKVDRAKFFKKFEFSYIVLDEAHSIKNVNSVRYQNLLKLAFRAEYRLMLTGTPLQNNVNELWALLNFLMPNIFGVAKDMKGISWPEEEGKDYADEVARIKKIISPFILRRLKSEVLGKLPPKKETIVWCQLTAYQKELYEKTFQYSKTNYYAIRKDPEEEEKKEVKPEAKENGEKVEEKPKEQVKVEETPKENSEEKKEETKEETDKEKSEEEKDPEVKEKEDSLHHILMQLRKAANNTLLFRYFYDDAKIYEIQDTLKREEEERKLQEQAKREQEERDKLAAQQVVAQAPAPEEIKAEPMEIKQENSEVLAKLEPMETTPIPPLQTPQQEITQPVAPKTEEVKPLDPTAAPLLPPLPMIGPEDVCGICLLEGNLLCCDGPCGRAFHLQCVGLQDEPTEEKWFCTDCVYFPKQETPATQSPHREAILRVMAEMEKLEDKNGRKRAILFLHLPSKELLPEYYNIIKSPISFNHIKQKYYENPDQFYADIKLLFSNARSFNRSGSQVYRDAVALEKVALVEIAKEFKDLVKLEEADKKAATTTPKRASTSTSRSRSSASANASYASPEDDSDGSEDEALPTSRRARNARSKRHRGAAAEDLDDYLEFEEEYETPKKRSRASRSESSRSRSRSSISEPKVPEPLPPRRKRKLAEPFLSCQEVLEDLMDQEDAAPFATPIDPVALGIPDYHDIVKKPMDLGTIWNKLNGSEYPNPDQFVDDVRLVFDNCLLYNEPNSEIGVSAQMLWTYFKRQCRKHSIKVPEAKAQLEHKQTKANNLASLADELKLKSDIEIHLFCKNYDCLKSKYCLNDEQILGSSGKLLELRRILSDLFEKNHRVLIFSQFTMVLNILEEFLTVLGYKYLRMDGSTPVLDRQMLIDEYNTNRKEIFVFLLSTRAAGLGINLTSADVCIFHDIDWNPEMDRQAEARVHRIGQMKEVEIIKILARESVDEYILKLADMKRHRNDLVMGEGKQEGAYSELDKLSIGKVLASIFEQQTETLK